MSFKRYAGILSNITKMGFAYKIYVFNKFYHFKCGLIMQNYTKGSINT